MSYAISKGQIKYIKTMGRQVFGADDDAYRLMLWGQARVKSCKDLRGPKIDQVIGHLERCLGKEPPARGRRRQVEEIRRRWAEVSRAAAPERERALRNFLQRRFGVAAPEWLSVAAGQKVIEGLKAMEQRDSHN